MDFLANIVQQVLTVLYNFTESVGIPNLGLAIVLMTIIIKLIMYPLTQKQIQSTKAMMEIQPKMKALQEKYKGNRPQLIRVDVKAGHGAGKPISKIIEEQADIWSFMFYNTGVTPSYK